MYLDIERRMYYKYRLLYFLRDIGIKSAQYEAVHSWLAYFNLLQDATDGLEYVD